MLNRRVPLWSVLALVVVTAGLMLWARAYSQSAGQRKPPAEGLNQRFALFQGTFLDEIVGGSSSDSKEFKNPGVFRIDTLTGKTWLYDRTFVAVKGMDPKESGQFSRWIEITEAK